MRQIDYFLKQDDVGGVIEATLYDASGAVVNLVGKTVDFHMVATSSTTPKVSTPATIVDAAGGRVNYTFATPDTDTPGYFEAEWRVVDVSTGHPVTYPTRNYHIIHIARRLP